MADICTATVTVQYNKQDNKIGSVEIDKKEDFLKCVTGEAKSVSAAQAPGDAGKNTSEKEIIGDGKTIGEALRHTTRQEGGRRKKSRRRGKRSGRKSKRRSSKKARKSKKSKRRRGKKSKRRRRRK